MIYTYIMGENMVKKKIKIILFSMLVILSLIISGCSFPKYNTIGNFNAEESKKLYKEKKYDEAIKNIDGFLEKYPRNKKAIEQKAYVLIGSGKNEDGLVLLTNLYENGVKDTILLNNMSWAYNNLRLYEMADKYIDICLKSSTGDEEEYVNKGNALHGLKKYDEAIEYYDKALKKNSKYTFALFGKGLCLYEKSDYAGCLDYFKNYVELSGDKDVNYYLRNAYLKQKDYEGAIEEFTKQIKNKPDDLSLYITLGYIYEKQGDCNKAINCYNAVINKKLDYASAYYSKSICLVKLGKKEEACDNLRLAIKYDEEYLNDIKEDPEFDSIRNYDKFREVINGN